MSGFTVPGRRPPGKGRTVTRGYGAEHQRERKRLEPMVARGEARCARCGLPIAPGSEWDLDHDDHDRRKYLGPSHRSCNRARKLPASRAPYAAGQPTQPVGDRHGWHWVAGYLYFRGMPDDRPGHLLVDRVEGHPVGGVLQAPGTYCTVKEFRTMHHLPPAR